MIDNTRASTAPGGRRSKPTQLDSVGARAMKRVLRSQTACTSKRPARGANALIGMQLATESHGKLKVQEELKAFRRRWKGFYKTVALGLSKPSRSGFRKARPEAKKKAAFESAIALFQPIISLDYVAQQQWDLLASSRRWRGLVQELINSLRPRFAGDAPFALKQSFALCDATESTSSRPRPMNLPEKTDAALLRLLAPTKPKRVASTIDMAAEAARSEQEQASRLRLARAVELLLGDLGQIKAMCAQIASPLQLQPGTAEPVIESEQKLCSGLCGAPAAA